MHISQMRGTPFFSVPMGDARGYDTWARQLAAGDWIGTEVFYQAPLYPYFLGAVYSMFGGDLLIVRVVQANLGSVSCVFVGYTAAYLFGSRAGVVAGLALAFYAPAIFFDSLIQKSVLDVLFVSAVLALLAYLSTGFKDAPYEAGAARHQRCAWIALGLAAGCLSLTRENALVLPVVIAAWAWFAEPGGRMSRATAVALLAGGMVAVILPVAVRNYVSVAVST
jgi:4-amino-4-deoxy-L-arabinose transferase-like glycosyltransferase